VSPSKKLAFVLLAATGLLCFILVLKHLLYVYPTPATQSAFLKNYSPSMVIEEFKCKGRDFQQSSTVSAGAGRKFASHQSVFEPRFVIKSKDWMPLMIALEQDLSSQLSRQGAEILSENGDPRDGYRIQYQVDKSFGEVAVEPLNLISAASLAGPQAILPDDEQAVDVRITILEKWFKSKPGIISVRVSDLKN
jgi:hypothetical protein